MVLYTVSVAGVRVVEFGPYLLYYISEDRSIVALWSYGIAALYTVRRRTRLSKSPLGVVVVPA